MQALGYMHDKSATGFTLSIYYNQRQIAQARLKSDSEDFSQYTSMYDLIQNRFAGVQILNGEIIIRGLKSLNASSAALIVLNGIPTDPSILNTLPPGDVKRIDVLKDGGTAAFGSRGANGVVLIETKRGEN